MKTIKVVLDFIHFPVAEKVSFYRNVIRKLTGNPLFPTPDVSLADANAAEDTLEASSLAARDGGHTAVSTLPDNKAEAGWLPAGSSTQASFELSGLAVGSKHYFRVAAITPDGMTDFSAPVLKVVV